MNYLKEILRFAIPYKAYAILNIISNVFYAFFGTLSMLSLFPMLKVLFGDTEAVTTKPHWSGIAEVTQYSEAYLNFFVTQKKAEGSEDVLLFMVGLVIVSFLLKNFFNYLAMFFITYLRNGVLKDIRNEMYMKIIGLPIRFFSEKRKGDTMARISSDVLEIQYSFLSILELIVREPLMIIFTLGSMFIISPRLTIFVLVFIPISGLIISFIGKSLRKSSDKVQKEQGHFLSIIEETLSGLKVIKGFNGEPIFNEKFITSTNRFYKYSNSLLNKHNLAGPLSEFLGILVIAILLWYGGQMVLSKNKLDPGLFLVYMGLAYNILTPAKAISKAGYNVKKGNAAAERVMEIIKAESPLKDVANAIHKSDFKTAIELNSISFKYEEEYVIKDLTISIPKGKTIALVGQSGSGKSTIANLVSRFYDVDKGTISFDGTDIKKISKRSLRNMVGLVTQDSILFNDSVKNNILLGNPEASEESIIDALKIANAWDFVKDMPNGIHSNIGDGGSKLSGGQQQRLSIARAVLKNPPIMILDEATSSLDTEIEKLVQDALIKMMENRTSLVIAHRLSTVQNADEIIVLGNGKIKEQGKHQELLDKKGVYYNLVKMQSLK
jgi:subfamily B ATP-binding cassette protein MsbA